MGRASWAVALAVAGCSNPATLGAPRPMPPGAVSGPALVNGDFAQGLEGWRATGDGARFHVFVDAAGDGRRAVTTFTEDGKVDADAVGTISQVFTVPEDAVALRFLVHGGRSRVRLYEQGAVVEEATGVDDNALRVPVSWDLLSRRGQILRLSIEDAERGSWGFVSVSGFDVIRDRPSPLTNGDFADGLNGWTQTGDAAHFNVFRDPLAGGRGSVSTAARRGPRQLDLAVGTLAQDFVVPDDAIALRFLVHGGRTASVRLLSGDELLHHASGVDSNGVYVPVSWDLQPHVGKTLSLAIHDPVHAGVWAFVGTTGFDVVTQANGP